MKNFSPNLPRKEKKWYLRQNKAGKMPENWPETLCISPELANILWNRGFNTIESANHYLTAPLNTLTHPYKWPQIPQAARLLVKELLAGKKLAIWGDYDADGVTSTTLVLDILEYHGFKPLHHLPNRTTEGYGLNIPYIEKLASEGCELLLTVDCGIGNRDVIKHANSLGIKVIVSDHHLPVGPLPEAQAIVDPRIREAGNWPCASLAGVGVAFYLMGAVNNLLEPHTGKHYKMDKALDLVALGTLADVMDLEGENRILVRAGLKKLERSNRIGLSALKEKCGINPGSALNSEQTVYMLTPRINAAGRMGDPGLALNLLRSYDLETARSLALDLNECNERRKNTENFILEEASKQAEELFEKFDYSGLVLSGENWHSGIIGIVASRIVENYNRPTIILTNDGNFLKGSGRSLNGIDLHAILEECQEYLTSFGGHSLAAGLKLEAGKLNHFRQAFNEAILRHIRGKDLEPVIHLDYELGFKQASQMHFIEELELMEPFGPGNPAPVFASLPLRVLDRSYLGSRSDSVKLVLKEEESGIILPAKVWRKASDFPADIKGRVIRIAYTPTIHCWNGIKNIELIPYDWHKN